MIVVVSSARLALQTRAQKALDGMVDMFFGTAAIIMHTVVAYHRYLDFRQRQEIAPCTREVADCSCRFSHSSRNPAPTAVASRCKLQCM